MLSQLGPFVGLAQMVADGTPQYCALVNSTTNIVENIIIADPAVDPAPAGYLLVGMTDVYQAQIGWIYDPATGQFTDPNA